MGTRKKRKKGDSEAGEEQAPTVRGLRANEVELPRAGDLESLCEAIGQDGGTVLAAYREPLGGHETVLAVLPADRVEPTPFQRDLSTPHVERLAAAIDQVGRFLDPIVVVPSGSGGYWTPNGNHRLAAMRKLGGQAITALVVPDRMVAYRILALNTEKSHNLKEKSLEVIRMARSLAELDPQPEQAYALQFDEPALLTLGCVYEKRARFSGSSYNPILKRVDAFLEESLPEALEVRESRGARLLELDDAVTEVITVLKERGFDNPYLRPFVVARINPLRFKSKGGEKGFDDVIDRMLEKAISFDPDAIKPEQVAQVSAGGPKD